MRIRKRWPTPSFAPPLESLHHQQPPSDPPIHEAPPPHPPRSDLQLTFVKGTNGWICKTDDDCMHSNSSSTQLGEEAQALPNDSMIGKSIIAATVHANEGNSSGAKGSGRIPSSASASHLEIESAMKIKTNATWKAEEDDSSYMMKKKRKTVENDSAVMDVSRCSRVNGRGWRCWKQTVVGYSLCEHHSTQGRLRSTASFKDDKQGHTAVSSSLVLLDEEPLIMLKKRKKKVGMIKNRSISGLLAQTEHQPAPPMPLLDSVAIL